MTGTTGPGAACRAPKAAHRAMWALGDYPTVADELIPDLGATLVAACGVAAGERVLDVAAGAGNAAIPAALAGADVVAVDLCPELLGAGRTRAARRGAALEWVEADAEALPLDDAEFDTVLSCVGVMFAPHHRVSADELVRVCRPGGTTGLLSWTPEGFMGQRFRAIAPYAPPPPPGTQPPQLWGSEEHIRGLLGDRVTEVAARRQVVTVDRFAEPEELRDYFTAHYGPTVALRELLAGDPERVAALDRDLAEIARRHDRGTSSSVFDGEYLLLTARRTEVAA